MFTVIVCRLPAIVKSHHQPIGHATPKVTWFGTQVGYSIVNLYADGDDWTDYHRATWTYLKRIIRSAIFFWTNTAVYQIAAKVWKVNCILHSVTMLVEGGVTTGF